jgi:hypothetical protein
MDKCSVCVAGLGEEQLDEDDRMIVPPDDDLNLGPMVLERPASEMGDPTPAPGSPAREDLADMSG